MLKSQGVPESQVDMLISMIEKNPELFQKIAQEIQEKIKGGMSQTDASIKVMEKYQEELKKLNQ